MVKYFRSGLYIVAGHNIITCKCICMYMYIPLTLAHAKVVNILYMYVDVPVPKSPIHAIINYHCDMEWSLGSKFRWRQSRNRLTCA